MPSLKDACFGRKKYFTKLKIEIPYIPSTTAVHIMKTNLWENLVLEL